MIDKLTSLMFFGVILILTIIEFRRVHNWITPFTLTAWPFVIISLTVNLVLGILGFHPVTLRVHLFVLANLILIWLVGFLFSYIYHDDKTPRQDFDLIFQSYQHFQPFIVIVSWIVIAVVYNRVRGLLSKYGGWSFLGDYRFELMMVKGLAAHFIGIGQVCFIYLIFIYRSSKNKIINGLTIVGLILAIASIQVKYHLMWIIIFAFLYHNVNKEPKKQLWSVFKVLLGLLLTMNLFWLVLTLAWGTFSVTNEGIYEFLMKQSLNYTMSSMIVLDSWMTTPDIMPGWTLLSSFINMKNFLTGNPNMINPAVYVGGGFFETAPQIASNVGSAYGVYYIIGGALFSFFMTVLFALVSYFLYYKAFTTKNPMIVYFTLLFCMLSMLTFFVQYFTLLTLYEMTLVFLIFYGIFRFANYVRSILSEKFVLMEANSVRT